MTSVELAAEAPVETSSEVSLIRKTTCRFSYDEGVMMLPDNGSIHLLTHMSCFFHSQRREEKLGKQSQAGGRLWHSGGLLVVL